ncbi:MAG TPA: glycosyltransferase family 4 protein [Candidatus Hydrogenedentes bacterium]|nr:glycosyltransferase family 4 protein [Candidatus Hydrogenedentota bacterium]HRK34506.1 glycosyltransferase family 4 protein [Candidatus Hydrogenedentota bacterium]
MTTGAAATSTPPKLRVLHVNKFHFLNGGAELYYLGLVDLLQKHGHTVGHFSMQHPENLPSGQSRYFIDNINYENPGGLLGKLRIAAHTVYSGEARAKIARLLDAETYDIVHLHNFHHQITPSILPEIRKRNIPIVFTVQDFKIVCPNYKMLTHDGVCERCKGHKYFNCTLHRCNKGSLLGSAINTVEMYFHHAMGYDALYDIFAAPSRFTGEKIIEFGIPREKVRFVPNFIHLEQYEPCFTPGNYLLYLGRLSQEKGVHTLIEAIKNVPEVPVMITGRGPYEEDIRRQVASSGLNTIKLTGHLSGEPLRDAIRNSMAVLIPSEWYENCPLALIEAYAYGKPVIGAKIGGLGDMVRDGDTGYQFEAGNVAQLTEVMKKAVNDRAKLEEMGRAARATAEREYGAEKQYELIMDIYREVLRS